MVFSIVLSRQPSPALLFFKLIEVETKFPFANSISEFSRSQDPKLTSAEDADRRATEAESYDTCLPNIRIPRKVLKGGSHLCAQVVGTALFAVAHP
jgi:hypothetical protein